MPNRLKIVSASFQVKFVDDDVDDDVDGDDDSDVRFWCQKSYFLKFAETFQIT
jgi:hypothetical protein